MVADPKASFGGYQDPTTNVYAFPDLTGETYELRSERDGPLASGLHLTSNQANDYAAQLTRERDSFQRNTILADAGRVSEDNRIEEIFKPKDTNFILKTSELEAKDY